MITKKESKIFNKAINAYLREVVKADYDSNRWRVWHFKTRRHGTFMMSKMDKDHYNVFSVFGCYLTPNSISGNRFSGKHNSHQYAKGEVKLAIDYHCRWICNVAEGLIDYHETTDWIENYLKNLI